MHVALTGAASGIGAATAAQLKQRGHRVTAFDVMRPEANIDHWVETDFSDFQSVDDAVDAVDGRFDALINNAGIPPRDGMAARVLMVNFLSLRRFWRGILDKLSDGAAIVSVASRAGEDWRENLTQVRALTAIEGPAQLGDFVEEQNIDPTRAYSLSKEAVIYHTITQTEALLARGMRANSVSPSAVSTGILDDFIAALGDRARIAIRRAGRAGKPEEIADLICFLASPDSCWIKGQDITIDGGISAMVLSDALQTRQ